MQKTAKALTTLMLGAAMTSAIAGPQEDCLNDAARKFHPGATYLAHKKIMMGSAAIFAVPNTLTLPTTAKHGLHPIFTQSSTGIVSFTTDMPSVYFYDRTPATLTKPGEAVSDKNIDDIGFAVSDVLPKDDNVRPDEARSYKVSPQVQTFVETVRACLKPV